LTGEKLRESQDPQKSTIAQRAWLPLMPADLKVVEKNLELNKTMNESMGFKRAGLLTNYKKNTSQILPYDIASSLPLAEGMYALESKYLEPGAFRKSGTDVTRIPNFPFIRK